jgi:cytochrome P450
MSLLLRPTVSAPLVLVVIYALYRLFIKRTQVPRLPVLNAKEGEWFPLLRASWRNGLDFKAATIQAYDKYRDEACLMPLVGSGNLVYLPASQIRWVIDQPDAVLSMHEAAIETLQTDYTVTDPSTIRNPVHTKLITTKLTNQIGNLVPDLADEIEWSLGDQWGRDTGAWKEVCVYDTMRRVIGIVTNRVFVGLPHCRDPELLAAGMAYAQLVPMCSMILRFFPSYVRPILAPIVTIPIQLQSRRFFRLLRTEIKRRLEVYDARRAVPERKGLEEEPNDFLQWSLNQAKEIGDPHLWQTNTLALRVLLLNFASIHTSSFAITHVILDLVCSKKEYIDELREEITTVLAEHGGVWDKRALSKMEKLDSVMRESQRINSFVTVGLNRLVTAPGGVTTPSGVHIPQGNNIVVPGYALHKDEELYPDAENFLPFRFAEKRADTSTDFMSRARQQWATTTNEYLAFGHGKYACPGRFFAAAELKMMLAHMVMEYDFEMQDSRPANTWIAISRIPPMKATVRIKRRTKS